MDSPWWLPFGLLVLVWGVQLAVRSVRRTRASGMGRRAILYGRIVPGIIEVLVSAVPVGIFVVAAGFRPATFWFGVPLLLCLMWGIADLVGGRLRLRDLNDEAEAWEREFPGYPADRYCGGQEVPDRPDLVDLFIGFLAEAPVSTLEVDRLELTLWRWREEPWYVDFQFLLMSYRPGDDEPGLVNGTQLECEARQFLHELDHHSTCTHP